MSKLDLPPDVIGHMSALGGTEKELDMCPSCQRAIVYGVLLYVACAGAEVDDAQTAIKEFDAIDAAAHLNRASMAIKAAISSLLEVAKTDFAGACNLVPFMNDEEYGLAMQAFYEERTNHYTDPKTGHIVFEDHDDPHPDDGDRAVTGA